MSSIIEFNTNNTDNQSGIYNKKKVMYNLAASSGEGDDWGDVEVESLVG